MAIVSSKYVFAVTADGAEIFGACAFPFRREQTDAVAFDIDGERRVLTALDARFVVLDPETNERLPSPALWMQANEDEVLRRAIKERCGL